MGDMPDEARGDYSSAASGDELPSGGKSEPPTLQGFDSNSEDDRESEAFWTNLGSDGSPGLERTATCPVSQRQVDDAGELNAGTAIPPALQYRDSNSEDDRESEMFWANLGNDGSRGLQRTATCPCVRGRLLLLMTSKKRIQQLPQVSSRRGG